MKLESCVPLLAGISLQAIRDISKVNNLCRLQAENQRLTLQEQKDKSYDAEPTGSSKYDESIQELRDIIDKQRHEIKDKHKELIEKSEVIDECQMEMEIYKHKIVEAKQRSKKYQSQVKNLFSEKADFLAKLQDQSKSINSLKQQLGIFEKESDSDVEPEELSTPRFTIDDLKEVLNERNDLKNRVIDLEEELASFRLSKKINQSELSAEQQTEQPDDDAPVQGSYHIRFLKIILLIYLHFDRRASAGGMVHHG